MKIRLHTYNIYIAAELGIKIETIQNREPSGNQAPISKDSVWYHEGPNELMAARFWIAEYSMPR